MKKSMLLSVLLTAFVLPVVGQSYDDDDMYYVPSKKASKTVTITVTNTSDANNNEDEIQSSSYAPINNRVDEMDVDAYNRRGTLSAVPDSQDYNAAVGNVANSSEVEDDALDDNAYVYTTRISRYNNPTVVLYLGDSYWDNYYRWNPYYSYYNSWGIGWGGLYYSSYYSPYYWGGYYGGYYPYYGGYYPYHGYYTYHNWRRGGFRPNSRPTYTRGGGNYASRSTGLRSNNFRSEAIRSNSRSGSLNSRSSSQNYTNEYMRTTRSYSRDASNSRSSQQRVEVVTPTRSRSTTNTNINTTRSRTYVPSTNNNNTSRSYTPSTTTNRNYSTPSRSSYSGGSSRSTSGGGSRGGRR